MGAENSQKKLKKKKPSTSQSDVKSSQLFHNDENQLKVKGENKKKKSLKERSINEDIGDQVDQPNVSGTSFLPDGNRSIVKGEKKKKESLEERNIIKYTGNQVDQLNVSGKSFSTDENLPKVKGEKKRKKSLEERKRNKDKGDQSDQPNVSDVPETDARGKKKRKLLRNNPGIRQMESEDEEKLNNMEDGINEAERHKKRKSKKKKRRNEKSAALENMDDEKHEVGTENQGEGSEALGEAGVGADDRNRNVKKAQNAENLKYLPSKDAQNLVEKIKHVEDDVYQISSGDEDSSKGMKKWITEYKQNRPGLKVLQERIDDFIAAHEEREEEARKGREAQAAEGGWTVVVHHKGRKKTTDSEGGVAVGSVAQAAVLDKMSKKKNKDVGLDFYRFQKREAHRNEIMMLQSKFEQDKKRIQQLRAQRKFRPY